MRICFLEGDMSRQGGTERMTVLLANALCDRHKVLIISLQFQSNHIFFDLDDRVEHCMLFPAKGKLCIVKQISQIRQILKQKQIDRVINVDTGMGFYGILAAKGIGAKVITWEHANFFNNWNSRLFPYLRKFAARHSHAMVVLTRRDKENFETHISRCRPVHVIHNPVQQHEVQYDSESKIILSAGLLLPIKGYDRAIEVAKRVLPSHPGWKWVICGEGPERKRLEQLITEHGLQNRIVLPGSVKNMDEQYQRAAVFVMTSDMEGLPMVLLEAKSWGLPIVSFDIMTGPSDIVTDGANGCLIPPWDINKMTQALSELLDRTELRYQYSQNSQDDIGRFQFEKIIENWNRLLEEL